MLWAFEVRPEEAFQSCPDLLQHFPGSHTWPHKKSDYPERLVRPYVGALVNSPCRTQCPAIPSRHKTCRLKTTEWWSPSCHWVDTLWNRKFTQWSTAWIPDLQNPDTIQLLLKVTKCWDSMLYSNQHWSRTHPLLIFPFSSVLHLLCTNLLPSSLC